MRFKKALFSSFFLLILVVGYIGYYNFHILPKDLKKYEQFVEEHKNDENAEAPSETTQNRNHTQKDIWQQDGNDRLHYRINATHSTLHLRPKKNKVEMFEEMQGISCLLQEKLYYQDNSQMQELRAFTASAGTYDFTKHEFLAEKVLLDFYTEKGHELPSLKEGRKPFLKGLAKQVSFTFSNDGSSFHAEKFKAEMQSIGSMK